MLHPLRHTCFSSVKVSNPLKRIVNGRAAKQKQERRSIKTSTGDASANTGGKTSLDSMKSISRDDDNAAGNSGSEQQNPFLPDEAVGSLNEFGSSSGRLDEQATNLVEQVSSGPTALTYAIWITVLLSAIGAFYGLVFAASGGLSNFLKDKVTFTRKDFVPYSERRSLEDNLKNSSQERQSAERSAAEPGGKTEAEQSMSGSTEGLYNLMPAPSLKK